MQPRLRRTEGQGERERVIAFCFAMESAQRAGKCVIDPSERRLHRKP
jgi:hypothetical protein